MQAGESLFPHFLGGFWSQATFGETETQQALPYTQPCRSRYRSARLANGPICGRGEEIKISMKILRTLYFSYVWSDL